MKFGRFNKLLSGTTLCMSLLALLPAHGATPDQTDAPPKKTPSSKPRRTDPNVENITVRAGTRSSVLPVKPAENPYDLPMSIENTPRSVNVLTARRLQDLNITKMNQLVLEVPGTYTASSFGIAGTPQIRGEFADNYFRGFRRVENDNAYDTPVEAASQIDIVSGLASPVYGAGKVGGYVNFIPKAATAETIKYDDAPSGDATAAFGSYQLFRQDLNFATPIALGAAHSGLDIYLENNNGSDYYRGIRPRSKIAQGEYSIDLPDGWTVNLGGQYYKTDGDIQTTGWDRVTQDLIDNSTYIAGSTLKPLVQPGQAYVTPADIKAAGGVEFGVPGPTTDYSKLNPATTHEVYLSRRTIYTSSYDSGRAQTGTAFLDIVKQLSANNKLKLQFFYDSEDVKGYLAYGFGKHLSDYSAETRLSDELSARPLSWLNVDADYGIGYRFYKAREGVNFANGNIVLDQRDLSQPATSNDIINPIFVIPYDPFDENFDTSTQDLGEFANVNLTFFDKLRVLVGGRWDYYNVSAENLGDASYNVPVNTRYNGDASRGSYTASVGYSLPFGINPYFTYANAPSLITLQGGGVDPNNVAQNNFLAPSQLVQAGIKGFALDHRLYYDFDVYRQDRTQFQELGGSSYRTRGEGFEGLLRFAVTRQIGLSVTGNQQVTKVSSGGVVVTPVQAGVPDVDGWGYYYSTGISKFVDRTLPYYTISGNVSYNGDGNWGGTAGVLYVGETRGELPNSFHAPAYELFNGSVFYKIKKFVLDFSVDNIFDRRYFVPLGLNTGYTEGAVLPGMGRTMLFQISRRF